MGRDGRYIYFEVLECAGSRWLDIKRPLLEADGWVLVMNFLSVQRILGQIFEVLSSAPLAECSLRELSQERQGRPEMSCLSVRLQRILVQVFWAVSGLSTPLAERSL
jgi:hypothetical protein